MVKKNGVERWMVLGKEGGRESREEGLEQCNKDKDGVVMVNKSKKIR